MYVVTDPAYGADPTGNTDSRAAIQAAMDAANTASPPGGVVYFPAGSYKIDLASGVGLQLKPRIQYVGEGRGNTTLKLGNSQAGDLLRVFSGGYDVVVRDLTLDLDGKSAEGTQALAVGKASRVALLNVEFTTLASDVKGTGLVVGAGSSTGEASEVSVQGCFFTQLGVRAIWARAGAQHLQISACFFTRKANGTLYAALHAEDDSASTSSTPRVQGLTFIQNTIDAHLDLRVKGRLSSATAFYPVVDVLLAHNRIVGNVMLEAVRDAVVEGNVLVAAAGAPLVVRRSRQVEVAGNHVAATTGHGIHIDGKAPGGVMFDFPVEEVLVVDNTVTQRESFSNGILVENAERAVVANNAVAFVQAGSLSNVGIHHAAGPNIAAAPPSTRRSVLVAQNTVAGFVGSFTFTRHQNAQVQGLVLANLSARGTTVTSATTALTFNPASHISRLVMQAVVVGLDLSTSLSDPPASLGVGTLGEDSGDTTGVGMYVCTAASNAPYIENASKGSLYVDRDATAPGATLFVRQSNGWVPK